MPATDPACPFLEQAPSVYTTSLNAVDDDEVCFDGPARAFSGVLDRPAWGGDSDPLPAAGVGAIVDEEDDGGLETTEVWLSDGRLSAGSISESDVVECAVPLASSPSIHLSASSRVFSFLYTAREWRTTCSRQSSLVTQRVNEIALTVVVRESNVTM